MENRDAKSEVAVAESAFYEPGPRLEPVQPGLEKCAKRMRRSLGIRIDDDYR